ncbi:hypothetical protein HU200_052357 [Digitaria exilis]|uniref:Uncharacterized protein n=1 Tax=Digitaria exilis TaxID=1010633 RepID=A0A835E7D1_9POAL|nr:hypothetical protein HU200_052357 [Digitaria exilis]
MEHRGHRSMLIILIDEQGTKMEGIVYVVRLNLINNMLVQGETYDFMRVAFSPTYDHPGANIFHLYSEYYVLIGTHTMINEPPRTVIIPECPVTFREFEDVYQQPQNTFAGISRKMLCAFSLVHDS